MSFDIMYSQALQAHQSGRLDEAEVIYRHLLETAPQNTDLMHLLAMIGVHKGATDFSLHLLYKAVKLSPKTITYRFTLAHALQEAGRPKEALEHYQAVLDQDDSMPETYNNIGVIHRSLGDQQQAKAFFLKALDKDSLFISAYANLSSLYQDLKLCDQAQDILTQALEKSPENTEIFAQMAFLLRCRNQANESIPFYEKALAQDPQNALLHNGLGIALEHIGKIDQAFEEYTHAITQAPRFADAYNNRGNIYVKKNKLWDAEIDFKKAVKIDPKYNEAFNNLGSLLLTQERYEEALECFRKAYIIDKKQPQTANNLANCVKAVGDLEEAIGLYVHAMMLDPELVIVQHNLAKALFELYVHKNQQELALNLSKKWVDAFPDNPLAKHLFQSFSKQTPKTADPEYIKFLFDSFADTFEQTLENIDYFVPKLIKDKLETSMYQHILDAGCGTGMLGNILKQHTVVLTGVDLSQKMLAQAKKKNVYDQLIEAELVTYLMTQNALFDLIVLCDVGCYFGDLKDLFENILTALVPQGKLVMTLEKNTQHGLFFLNPTGRFSHTKSFVEECLKQNNFSHISIEEVTLRNENNTSVEGFLIQAVK